MFVDICQREWDQLPFPDAPIAVGLDGGYLRRWHEKKRYFEAAGDPVVAGKSIPPQGDAKYFGFVDAYKRAKPKRRLFEVLRSQGMMKLILILPF